MTEPIPQSPVFIDQMPDYQQAVQQVNAMSKDEKAFLSIVRELGLEGELEKLKVSVRAMGREGQAILDTQQSLDRRAEAMNRKNLKTAKYVILAGQAVAVGGGTVVGIVAGKRLGVLKGILAGAATALAAGAGWLLASIQILKKPGKEMTALSKEIEATGAQKEQFIMRATEVGQQFTERMATRMLEEQKMLVGQGVDMKLVSTAEPQAADVSTSPNMAARYAVPPAASNAEAALQSKIEASRQR